MAIAEIGKLNLIAMSYEKDAVLNALQRTGATEIKLLKETENTAPMIKNTGLLPECLAYFESALENLILPHCADQVNIMWIKRLSCMSLWKRRKIKSRYLPDRVDSVRH